jgi:hypothetical protein
MQWPVGCGEGQVEEKGFVLWCFLEEGNGFLADGIGEVVIRIIHEFPVDGLAVPAQAEGGEETVGSSENSVKRSKPCWSG